MSTHYQVVIVGGGTGGIMTAAQLRRKNRKLRIALIEPNTVHCGECVTGACFTSFIGENIPGIFFLSDRYRLWKNVVV